MVSANARTRRTSLTGTSGVDHDALEVVFDDGTTLILDWHHTLDPQHPLIQTPEQWCMGSCV